MRARADMDWPEGLDDGEGPANTADSLRTWLVRGTKGFGPNRRRRGRNAHARQLLVADSGWLPGDRSGWRGLVTALQRHSVIGALSGLHRSDREILTLAYLQGHTNLEIARMLQVSVRTVSRRLGVALSRLEAQARNVGIWIASLALVALTFLTRPQERIMNLVRSAQWQQAAGVVATGTLVVALGVASGSPATSQAKESRFAPSGHSVMAALPAVQMTIPAVPAVTSQTPALATSLAPIRTTLLQQSTPQSSGHDPQGCGPHATNAPPATPVRSHHGGSPVDGPGPRARGCKTH